MNEDLAFADDPLGEIAALVRRLHETQERLQELGGGEVDAVMLPDGQSYLLHKAQERLLQSETAERAMAAMQSSILNALPAHIALLDHTGVITFVNDRWRNFAVSNALDGSDSGVGQNYLDICENAQGDEAEEAHQVGASIRAVLVGAAGEVIFDYPCHSPTERRWFRLRVSPMEDGGSGGAVIMHMAITEEKLAEEAVRESEERFRLTSEHLGKVLDSSLDVICTFNGEGRFTQVNAACEKIWGYLPAELLGQTYLDFVLFEDRPKTIAISSQIMAGKPTTRFENRYVRKDGSRAHIMWSASWSEADQSMFCVARDVTEGHHHEEQLRLLETCVECLNDVIIISQVESFDKNEGPRLGIVYVNPAFERLTGYTSAEAIGKVPSELLRGPRTDPFVAKRIAQAMKNREPARAELVHYRKSGEEYWGEINLAPIFSSTGEMTHVVSVERDNTAALQTRERIAEQAALINQAHDAIYVCGLDLQITFWNKGAERLYGWTAAEVAGCRFDTLFRGEATDFSDAERSLLQKGEWSGELQKTTKSESKVIVESRWTLLRDAAGLPKNYLHIDTDITERKKTELQFLRAQRMDSIGTLAGGIAHDLNNMLAPIMMSLEILKMKFPDAETESLLNTLSTSARHGADLVSQVLSFARGVEGQRIVVNPFHILKDIREIALDTFPKSINFELLAPHTIWSVTGDPTQIHQVFLNLCVNARDAMPEGGQLRVTLENVVLDETYAAMNPGSLPGAFVLIKVADNGTGIPLEVQERIFEPFFTTKEIGKGTGLGLSTTIAIIHSHKGFINLYSEMNRGTTFSVYLPAQSGSTDVEEVAIEQTSLPRGHGEVILIVDDEDAIRLALKSTLERFGYGVLLASNGAEAIAAYARQPGEIAAVLTDMTMPIMDGPATIAALQSLNPDVKILGSSGLAVNIHMAKAMGAGITHFVPKPYTAEILLQKLRLILEE